MLRAMRNDFKKYSWTLWLVIIAFVGGFIMTDAFSGKSKEKTGLIYVNDELMVRGEEFQNQLMRTLDSYKNQFKNNLNKSMINQFRIPENILRNLYNVALIRAESEGLNLSATDEELKQKIVNYPAFQRDGKFIGQSLYRQLLAHNRIQVKDFEDQLKDEIIREKYQYLITGALVIDEDTLKTKFKEDKDKAEVDLIRLNTDRVKEEIKLDDADPSISEYYESHKDDFKSKEERSGYVIAYNYDDYKKDVDVPLMELRNYFRDNRSEFITPEKIRVSRILLTYDDKNREEILKQANELQKTLTPDNFADQAKLLSKDDKAAQGGDHGYTAWKQFTSQEQTIINGLTQDQISTPVDTQSGFAIVYVPEKVDAVQQNFDDVKDKIKASLEDEKVKKLVADKLQKVYDKLKDADDIKAKATEMEEKVIETGLIASGKEIKDVDQNGYISRNMFSMKEKEISFPVQYANGIAIVQLMQVKKPEIQPFEMVKEEVKSKVIAEKKLNILMEDAKKYAAALNNISDEKKMEEYLKSNDLTKDSATYKLGNKLSYLPVKEGLDQEIFSAPEKQFNAPLRFDNAVVIYSVKEKTISSDADFTTNREEFYQSQVDTIKNQYFASYISKRLDEYKISINQNLYQEIKDWVLARYN